MRDIDNLVDAIKAYTFEPDDDEEYEPDDAVLEVVDDAFIAIDWREEEFSIVEAVAEKIQATDKLSAEFTEEKIWITLNGEKILLPLTLTPHDRYVAISSLAYLLRDRYVFWQLVYRLEDDTHELLLTTLDQAAYLEEHHSDIVPSTLARLRLGHDYFHGIDVPYIENEDHNPSFDRDSQQVAENRRVLEEETRKLMEEIRNEVHRPSKPWWKFW